MTQAELLQRLDAMAAEDAGRAVLATFTDEVMWRTINDFVMYLTEERLCHLLELRAYNASGELHALRSSMEAEFATRVIADEPVDGSLPADDEQGFCRDEWQFLDIDEQNSSGTHYKATASGEYDLPVADARYIHVRNYYRYDAEGIATFADFRIVGLCKKGEVHG